MFYTVGICLRRNDHDETLNIGMGDHSNIDRSRIDLGFGLALFVRRVVSHLFRPRSRAAAAAQPMISDYEFRIRGRATLHHEQCSVGEERRLR